MLVRNISHEHDLIFKRMDVQVISVFIRIVLHKDPFCHRGKNQLFIHELAQGAFDFRSRLVSAMTVVESSGVNMNDAVLRSLQD